MECLQANCIPDWFHDAKFGIWSHWGAAISGRRRRLVCALSTVDRAIVEYSFYLGSLWDLIKITNYQDISVFRRAWALVLGWSIGERLRRDSDLALRMRIS
jgi:hypothetical protein